MSEDNSVRHLAYVEADFESLRRGGACRTAVCLCGWKGPQRVTLELAADDALLHERSDMCIVPMKMTMTREEFLAQLREAGAGAAGRSAMTREEFLAYFREAHYALHRCWTKAVGTADYNKDDWNTIDNAMGRFARLMATVVGIDQKEPLLP
jgi:uncharacterized short protein YbdD (DUF466 family)